VLGVLFSSDLSWDKQVEKIASKTRIVLAKLKFLSRYLPPADMAKVVTSHLFGLLYYGSQTWLNELTAWSQRKKLNSIHYRALRICIKDFRNKTSRATIDAMFKRATPIKWMHYSNAKMAISLMLLKNNSTRLGKKLQSHLYINDRCPGQAITMDTSRLRIGKNSFINRLHCLRSINFDWTSGINPDQLRINLKITFIKPITDATALDGRR